MRFEKRSWVIKSQDKKVPGKKLPVQKAISQKGHWSKSPGSKRSRVKKCTDKIDHGLKKNTFQNVLGLKCHRLKIILVTGPKGFG